MAKEFSPAPEVESIAEKIIEILKPEINDWEIPIKYIFNSENPKKDGREVAGLARKVVGLNAYLAGYPDGLFLIETGRPAFDGMTAEQQIAYVHHELCHFGLDDLSRLQIIPHDLEEFDEVAEIHGAWHDGIIKFHDALDRSESDTSTRDEIIDRILNG